MDNLVKWRTTVECRPLACPPPGICPPSRFCRSARLWQFVLQLVRPGANLDPAGRDMKHPEVSDQAATTRGVLAVR